MRACGLCVHEALASRLLSQSLGIRQHLMFGHIISTNVCCHTYPFCKLLQLV